MATVKCAHRSSVNHTSETNDTEVLLNTVLCLDCGRETDMFGRKVPWRPRAIAPSFQERKAAGEVQ